MCPKFDERLSEKEARQHPLLLNKNDRELVRGLRATRFLTTAQGIRLLGISRQALHKRLVKLYHYRYIDWVSTGFYRHLYTLDTMGAEYLIQADNTTLEEISPRKMPSPFFLEHSLAIADVYVAVTVAARAAGVMLTWRNEAEATDHYQLTSGKECKLEPDAVFLLTGKGIRSTLVFLEVDRATESTRQWNQKVQDYNQYFLSGRVAQRWQLPPRILVLVTTPDLRRLESLRESTKERWQAQRGDKRVPVAFAIQESLLRIGQLLSSSWPGLEGDAMVQLVLSDQAVPGVQQVD